MNRLPLWTSLVALFASVLLLVAVSRATIRHADLLAQVSRETPAGQASSSAVAFGRAATSTRTAGMLTAATSSPARPRGSKTSTAAVSNKKASSPAAVSAANFANASARLRAALVNIMCYAPASSSLHSISGSGVIIDPKGIILTNAHVAQYFLLANQGVSCVIRAGTPATDRYDATIEYLSPAWIVENAGVLTEHMPTGTGEHDYALLAITGTTTGAPLPARFPAISLALAPPQAGADVVIASYGAQFLNPVEIQDALSPTVVYGSIKGIFTFATSSVDVLSLGGSAAAQEGSSGGGVVDGQGRLVGLITTSTVTGATATRSLDAITASYIRADYAAQAGTSFDALLAQDPVMAAQAFAPRIPALEAAILGASTSTTPRG